jgi:uncharacterized protein YceK
VRYSVLLILAVTAALGGCSTATGTLHGTIVAAGGPSSASPEPLAGTVTVTGGRTTVARRHVAAGGQFSVHLAAGHYRLSTDAGPACVATTITVTPGTDQAVTLICLRK